MSDEKHEVVVIDVRIPFWSMVVLMVKWAIAAIPAVIILFAAAGAVGVGLGMIFGPEWHWYHWGGTRQM